MRILLLLAAVCLSAATLTSALSCPARGQISGLSLATGMGPASYTPAFSKNTQTYTVTVPYEAEYVYLTAWTHDPDTTLSLSFWAGACVAPKTCTINDNPVTLPVKQSGVRSGIRSNQLPLVVGRNRVAVGVTCGCTLPYYITIIREPCAYTMGDPIFAGLLGQVFQVHGISGEVYNLVSDRNMQMNSRFIFLNHGSCPIINGHKANGCWTHPGSYLGEIGVKTCNDDRIFIRSGGAKQGFLSVQFNGAELEQDEVINLNMNCGTANGTTVDDEGFYVVRNSSHLVTIKSSNFLFQIENSDHFVNYMVKVIDWEALPGTHGLLGQTYRKPTKPGQQVKEIEGRVDDYRVEKSEIFGDEFTFNQFELEEQKTEQKVVERVAPKTERGHRNGRRSGRVIEA